MENNKAYEDYLKRFKKISVPLDDQMMYSRIGKKINRQPQRARLILAASLAVIFIGFSAYFIGRSYFSGGNITLAEYIFQQNDQSNDSIMDYVLADR